MGKEENGKEWKLTYGSLGTGVGVSDSNPFTTVGSTGVDAGGEGTDVVTVTTGQRYPMPEEQEGDGRRKVFEEIGKSTKVVISPHSSNTSPPFSLRSKTHPLYQPQFPGFPF